MLNMFIAILAEKEVLDEEEAKLLVEKLRETTLPGDYVSSRAMVKKVFSRIAKDQQFVS